MKVLINFSIWENVLDTAWCYHRTDTEWTNETLVFAGIQLIFEIQVEQTKNLRTLQIIRFNPNKHLTQTHSCPLSKFKHKHAPRFYWRDDVSGETRTFARTTPLCLCMHSRVLPEPITPWSCDLWTATANLIASFLRGLPGAVEDDAGF